MVEQGVAPPLMSQSHQLLPEDQTTEPMQVDASVTTSTQGRKELMELQAYAFTT